MKLGGKFYKAFLSLAVILVSIAPSFAQETSREVVLEKYARMRARPSVESATIFQFPAFAKGQAFNFDGIYWLVKYKEFTGYIIDSSVESDREIRAALFNRITAEGQVERTSRQARPPFRFRELPEENADVLRNENDAMEDDQKVYDNIKENNTPETVASDRGFVLGGSFGFTFPVQPPRLTDYWLPGPHFSGFLGYRFNSVFEINVEYSQNRFGIDEEAALLLLNEDNRSQSLDETITLGSAFLNLKFHLGGYRARVSPYFMIGGGLFTFKASEANFDYVLSNPPEFLFLEDESVPGFNLGVGLNIRVAGPLHIFGEGRALFGVTRDEGTFAVPVKGGIYLLF